MHQKNGSEILQRITMRMDRAISEMLSEGKRHPISLLIR
jgi:hypothetical protein